MPTNALTIRLPEHESALLTAYAARMTMTKTAIVRAYVRSLAAALPAKGAAQRPGRGVAPGQRGPTSRLRKARGAALAAIAIAALGLGVVLALPGHAQAGKFSPQVCRTSTFSGTTTTTCSKPRRVCRSSTFAGTTKTVCR